MCELLTSSNIDSLIQTSELTTLVRAYFNHLLHAIPAYNALFQKRNAFFSTKTSKNTCILGGIAFSMP